MTALDLAAADLLDRAAGRVARGWTQGELARDTEGSAVFPESPHAVCWCAHGAIAADVARQSIRNGAHGAIYNTVGLSALWNDAPGRTQDEVVDAMRAAAARLRGEA